MRLRTRRTDQRATPAEHPVRGVVKARDGYLEFKNDASVIDWTGSIVGEVALNMDGRFLIAIDLNDEEFEALVLARLNMRPAATLGAIGRALATDADSHDESVEIDPLRGASIDRSRSAQSRGWWESLSPREAGL